MILVNQAKDNYIERVNEVEEKRLDAYKENGSAVMRGTPFEFEFCETSTTGNPSWRVSSMLKTHSDYGESSPRWEKDTIVFWQWICTQVIR